MESWTGLTQSRVRPKPGQVGCETFKHEELLSSPHEELLSS